jgi:hypothetical protein
VAIIGCLVVLDNDLVAVFWRFVAVHHRRHCGRLIITEEQRGRHIHPC